MPENTPDETRPTVEEWASAANCCDYDHHSIHDLLLTFESRGMAGVRYVLEAINLSADQSDEPGELHWAELLNFIGQHNWQDPYAVHVFGRHIDDAIRARKESYELRAVPMQPEVKAS